MLSVLRAGGIAGRVALGVAGVAAAGALLSGCGVSQLSAAAFVGGTEIPVGQVHSQLVSVLHKEDPGARAQLAASHQLDDLSRKLLTLRIQHQLLEIAAQRAGVSVDQTQVDKLIAEVGGAEAASKGTIYDATTYRERAKDKLLLMALGRAALHTSAVTVDYTTATTRTAAKQRVDELAAAGSKRARQMIDDDVHAGKSAELGKRIVAADDPAFATTLAFGVAEGTVVGFQPDDTKPWFIMVVKNRTDRGAQASQYAPQLDQIEPQLLEAIGLRQLTAISNEVGVRLNPRYGLWDPSSLQVVPDQNEIVGFLAPLRAAPGA
ncbi:MAG TPA: hypothetical protein VFO16_22505 [Pseudonocardiaceae bacterium]|nr:hypothetical protein [Pseudonocardiaceae bacterium]